MTIKHSIIISLFFTLLFYLIGLLGSVDEENSDSEWVAQLQKVELASSALLLHQEQRLIQYVDSGSVEDNNTNKTKSSSGGSILSDGENKNLLHVSYVHYLDTTDAPTIDNFKFFMHFAYSPCDRRVFFTIILNQKDVKSRDAKKYLTELLGESLYTTVRRCLIEADMNNSERRNTQILLRENQPGGDLCAQVDFLRSEFWLSNEKLFKFFLFINSSVRGPFLPSYFLKPWLVINFSHFFSII
jgi:hypothetical protein